MAEVTLSEFESKPSVDNLRGLSAADFDHFLRHVFELAGYAVHKDNGSLYLTADNRVEAVAHVSYSAHNNVGPGPIEELGKASLGARWRPGVSVLSHLLVDPCFRVDGVAPPSWVAPHLQSCWECTPESAAAPLARASACEAAALVGLSRPDAAPRH
jgi:hypothetical protein